MVRNTFLPNAMSTAARGNAPRWRMDGGRRYAPEGQRNVATGEAWSDRCRTRRNPWFPGASANSPGRGGRDASAALPLPGRLLVSDPRAAGSASRRPRRGFTLVELLVTITIITMLAGLVLGGLSMARTSAREMKTKATIAKLDEIVMRMYAGYANRRVPINVSQMTRAQAVSNRYLGLRDIMQMEMPDSTTDLGLTQGPGTGIAPPALHAAYHLDGSPGVHVGAACLYMIVSIAHPRELEHFAPDEIGTINGVRVFIDAWGHPIEFVRWPTGFPDSDIQPPPNVTPADDKFVRDPFDTHGISNQAMRLPLVYSAGPDGFYGLDATGAPITDTDDPEYQGHYDNIHNHRLDIR